MTYWPFKKNLPNVLPQLFLLGRKLLVTIVFHGVYKVFTKPSSYSYWESEDCTTRQCHFPQVSLKPLSWGFNKPCLFQAPSWIHFLWTKPLIAIHISHTGLFWLVFMHRAEKQPNFFFIKQFIRCFSSENASENILSLALMLKTFFR